MLSAIGIIIALYVIARYVEMMKSNGIFGQLYLICMIIATVILMGSLFGSSIAEVK